MRRVTGLLMTAAGTAVAVTMLLGATPASSVQAAGLMPDGPVGCCHG